MIIRGNILDINENDNKYTLINEKGVAFPVYFDGVNTHILNSEISELKNINVFKKYANIRIDYNDEDSKTIETITEKFK